MIRKKRLIICLFILVGTLLVGSCSGLKKLAESANVKRPRVEFVGANLTGLSFQDADFMFDIAIENPNPLGIRLAGFDYDFLINENSFINGDQEEGIEIKAQGDHTVHFPVSIAFLNLYETFRNLQDSGTSTYQLQCGFSFDLPVLGIVRVPVSTKGDFPLLKLPAIHVEGLSLKHLGLTGADLELGIGLNNPNTFSMLLERFTYQFLINGQSWASGEIREKTKVSEQGESLLSIPISLDFLKVGQSVYQMLAGDQQLNYQLKGDLDIRSTLPLLEEANLNFNQSGITELLR